MLGFSEPSLFINRKPRELRFSAGFDETTQLRVVTLIKVVYVPLPKICGLPDIDSAVSLSDYSPTDQEIYARNLSNAALSQKGIADYFEIFVYGKHDDNSTSESSFVTR